MANLPTGGLTPRSNNKEVSCRYTGGFGQPDGFASVLEVTVNRGGDLALTLHWTEKGINMWSVMLTNEQRKHLSGLIASYDPVLWEPMNQPKPSDDDHTWNAAP